MLRGEGAERLDERREKLAVCLALKRPGRLREQRARRSSSVGRKSSVSQRTSATAAAAPNASLKASACERPSSHRFAPAAFDRRADLGLVCGALIGTVRDQPALVGRLGASEQRALTANVDDPIDHSDHGAVQARARFR
jgi:hypothetical protein